MQFSQIQLQVGLKHGQSIQPIEISSEKLIIHIMYVNSYLPLWVHILTVYEFIQHLNQFRKQPVNFGRHMRSFYYWIAPFLQFHPRKFWSGTTEWMERCISLKSWFWCHPLPCNSSFKMIPNITGVQFLKIKINLIMSVKIFSIIFSGIKVPVSQN